MIPLIFEAEKVFITITTNSSGLVVGVFLSKESIPNWAGTGSGGRRVENK